MTQRFRAASLLQSIPQTVSRGAAQRIGFAYRWIILAVCAASAFQVSFHAYAYATLLPTLMGELGISNSQVGSLLSAYFITYGLMQIPIGYVADRLGSRRVMLGSLTTFSVGVFLIPLSFNYLSGLATRLIVGLGASAVYVPSLRLVPNWFPQRRMGLVLGLISSGSALGNALALVLIPWLASVFTWRIGYLFAAASVPAVLVLVWLFLRREPAEVGLPPTEGALTASPGPLLPLVPALRRVVLNRQVWPYAWGTAIYYGGYAGLLAWTPTYLIEDLGYSREAAGLIAAIFPLTNIATIPLAGAIADRTGRRKLVFLAGLAGNGVAAVAFALLAPGLGPPGHSALMVLLSLSASATLLPFPIIAQLVEPPVFGTAVGLVNSFYFVGAIAYPIILGAAVDLTGARGNAFLTIGLLALVGLVVVSRGREGREGREDQESQEDSRGEPS